MWYAVKFLVYKRECENTRWEQAVESYFKFLEFSICIFEIYNGRLLITFTLFPFTTITP